MKYGPSGSGYSVIHVNATPYKSQSKRESIYAKEKRKLSTQLAIANGNLDEDKKLKDEAEKREKLKHRICEKLNSSYNYSKKNLINELLNEGYDYSDILSALKLCNIDWGLRAAILVKRFEGSLKQSPDQVRVSMRYLGFSNEEITHAINRSNNISKEHANQKRKQKYKKHHRHQIT